MNKTIKESSLFWLLITTSLFYISFMVVPHVARGAEGVDEGLEKEIQLLLEENRRLSKRLEVVERELREIKAERDEKVQAKETLEARADEKPQEKDKLLAQGLKGLSISGLLEFGGAYQHLSMDEGEDMDESDLAMTTVELDVSSRLSKWVSVTGVFLFEDPTFVDEETSLDVDSASIVLGNADVFPMVLTMGKVYVPFGALLTHFPDAPLIASPLTLLLGETNEKAVIAAYTREGYTFSFYAFNGESRGGGIDSYGLDLHFEYGLDLSELNFYKRGEKFKHDPRTCIDFLLGASYISDLSDSDSIQDTIDSSVKDRVGGVGLYLHGEHRCFFVDVEFMGAVESFSEKDLPSGKGGARPYVWNLEAGFNYNWWKNLEFALKVSGSEDAEALGLPEKRLGFNVNQSLFEGVTLSLGYLHDEFHRGDREGRDMTDTFFGQMAVDF